MSKKLARTADLFYKIRHYAPTDTLTLLYHGIFAPFISYGLSVWGSTYPTYADLIFIMQKKILKVITLNGVTVSSTPLFDCLQILKLGDLFKLQVTSFVYECLSNFASVYFRDYFTSIHSIHSIGTRQSKNVTCMQYIVIPLSMVYDPSITLVSVSEIHSRSILESLLQTLRKKLKDYFWLLIKYEVKLTNGLPVVLGSHVTIFIHLLGICYLIY